MTGLNNINHSQRFMNSLRYCRRMQFTNRCNGQPQVLPNYNVLLHGASMVQLYYLLVAEYEAVNHSHIWYMLESEALVKAMLFHDGIEQFTGDILAPAKWKAPTECSIIEQRVYAAMKDNGDIYDQFNIVYTDDHIEEELDQNELHVFKYLDMAEYALRLLEERSCGNNHERVKLGLHNARKVCKDLYGVVEDNNRIKEFLRPLHSHLMNKTREFVWEED